MTETARIAAAEAVGTAVLVMGGAGTAIFATGTFGKGLTVGVPREIKPDEHRVAITPDGAFAYVTDNNGVVVISTATIRPMAPRIHPYRLPAATAGAAYP
mgnify:CR=1 FL=1